MSCMENSKSTLHVEVAYALPTKQQIVALEVPAGTTVRAVAMQSALDKQFAGLNLETAELGVFGKSVSKPDQQLVKAGDRVEIYRPLIADPKEVRKQRAAKVKARKAADQA
ncbi:MAG: RnfH family protein [Spongiibacteraceae bacterium]